MERYTNSTNTLLVVALLVCIVAIAILSYALATAQGKVVYITRNVTRNVTVYKNVTTPSGPNVMGYNITSQILVPATSYSDSPVVTANESFGHRLTGIDSPFNASALSIINNAPDSYYETAGEMYLNHSLANNVGTTPSKLPLFILNGKPTVIYLGSITCVYCGENRWAMALALSRFGNFSNIFIGYSSFGDADLPTIYWAPAHYNESATVAGDFYNSNYINFLAIEDGNPITGGFDLNPISTMQQRVNATGNLAYEDAMDYVISTQGFQGTPFTIWGAYEVPGADAVVFGDAPPSNSTLQMSQWTHGELLSQLADPNDQFAWSEYAAADFYVAMVCQTLNNTAPVCSLPAIQKIETSAGL